MATEFLSPAQVIFGPIVFSFQFLVLVSLEYWQNGLYKLSNEVIQQIWSKKKVLTAFWQSPKIQDGRNKNPRWRLSDVMWRRCNFTFRKRSLPFETVIAIFETVVAIHNSRCHFSPRE